MESGGARPSLLFRVASALARRAPAFALVFLVGAAAHVRALAWPDASDVSPPWRHALFLAINLFFVFAFSLRWRWTVIPCGLLVLQQSFSHGADLVRAARLGAWDLPSVAVLLVLPFVLLAALGLSRPSS